MIAVDGECALVHSPDKGIGNYLLPTVLLTSPLVKFLVNMHLVGRNQIDGCIFYIMSIDTISLVYNSLCNSVYGEMQFRR